MTGLRGWGMPEQHLALDALVAFVDGELSPSAHDRAVAHLAHCTVCSADASTQRQARAAVRSAGVPSISSGLLQALQAIPANAELPERPDELGVTQDGQLVALNRRPRAGSFGSGAVLGSSAPLGSGPGLGSSTAGEDSPRTNRHDRHTGRRTKQGAGVVFSGLVLGTLALINLPTEDAEDLPSTGPVPFPGSAYSPAVLPASIKEATTPVAPRTALPDPSVAARTPVSPSPSPTSMAAPPPLP